MLRKQGLNYWMFIFCDFENLNAKMHVQTDDAILHHIRPACLVSAIVKTKDLSIRIESCNSEYMTTHFETDKTQQHIKLLFHILLVRVRFLHRTTDLKLDLRILFKNMSFFFSWSLCSN